MGIEFRTRYSRFVNWVRDRSVRGRNLENSLGLAELYGDLCWLNYEGRYADDELEEVLTERVCKALPSINDINWAKRGRTIILATELYHFGGHSEVIKCWLRALGTDRTHNLVVTRSVPTNLLSEFFEHGIDVKVCDAFGLALVSQIISECADAERIVLHIHPSDIVATIASRILKAAGKHIVFFNHADHVFSFGMNMADVVCAISNYGLALNERVARGVSSVYLGIPMRNAKIACADNSLAPAQNSFTLISCGSPAKYESPERTFLIFVDRLLISVPNSRLILVGPSGNEAFWRDRRISWGDRVTFAGRLAKPDYEVLLAAADLYVDSFPLTGGTAFPEALLSGKNCVGLRSAVQGYSPADELKVATIDDLLQRIRSLLNGEEDALESVNNIRRKAQVAHSLEDFSLRVRAMYSGKADKPIPWIVPVNTEWLENQWSSRRRVNLPHGRTYHKFRMLDSLGLVGQLTLLFCHLRLIADLKFAPALYLKARILCARSKS